MVPREVELHRASVDLCTLVVPYSRESYYTRILCTQVTARKMKLRQKATFVFPFVWPLPPYPRAMGTLDHPLALVHEQYLPDESVKVRVVPSAMPQSRTCALPHRLQRDEDQGCLFSSHNTMRFVVLAPSNAHAWDRNLVGNRLLARRYCRGTDYCRYAGLRWRRNSGKWPL